MAARSGGDPERPHCELYSVPYEDLRDFIAAVERLDELRPVRGADWDLEIGTLAELNYERGGPALLFDEIAGYPRGYRVLTNAVDTPRRALLALELPLDLDREAALVEHERRYSAYAPVPPVAVSTGPIFENVFEGAAIDLWKFPTPRWHEHDGGRYLGTGCVVFMRDPDSGRVNFGTYRVMVHDRTTTGLYISPNQTGAYVERKYWARGESCPVAVSFGQDPAVFLGAAPYLGPKRSLFKYEMVGHARGAPVEVVHEEVTGLPIPATAEIVIAGEVPPPGEAAHPEGPFGEWTGYYASGTRPAPIIQVKALYHRNDPIILGMPPVKARHSTTHFGLPTDPTNVRAKVKDMGVEDVLDVWPLAVPGVTVVQIRQRYPGHAMKAALAASGEYMGRFVVVVDEDVDPRDPEQVLWAIGTRCDPATSLTILTGCQTSALDPRIPPERKQRGDFTSSRAIINACKPYEWIQEFPITNVASAPLREQVLARWKDLF
jgi:4-hydroxy-3-polyprenylbenzoate decarboxylase